MFSKDRAAQLDLLLRSIDLHMAPESTAVLWDASQPDYRLGYEMMLGFHDVEIECGEDFNEVLRELLVIASGRNETVTFFCDDDVVYRPVRSDYQRVLGLEPELFAISLRLGRGNKQMRAPEGFPCWRWEPLPRHDFGFPASVDGHTFRAADVLRLLGGDHIPNPTMLETIMAHRVPVLANERPLLASFYEQCVVGVPVNRVSDQSGVAHGERYPQTAAEMNARWLAGQRISLERLDTRGINACHWEIPFQWENR